MKKPHYSREKLPTIFLDEHIAICLAEEFRVRGFRTIRIGLHARLRGRDERDFISELYQENGVFVTSDVAALDDFESPAVRHGGLVFVPKGMDLKIKTAWASIVASEIRAAVRKHGQHYMRGVLLYPTPLRPSEHSTGIEIAHSSEGPSLPAQLRLPSATLNEPPPATPQNLKLNRA